MVHELCQGQLQNSLRLGGALQEQQAQGQLCGNPLPKRFGEPSRLATEDGIDPPEMAQSFLHGPISRGMEASDAALLKPSLESLFQGLGMGKHASMGKHLGLKARDGA